MDRRRSWAARALAAHGRAARRLTARGRAGAQNPRFPVPPGARTRVERRTSSPLRGYARRRRRTRKIPDSQFRRMRRRAETKTSSSLGVLRAQKPEPPAPFWGHARRNPRLQPRLKHLRAESPTSSSKFGLDAGDSARGALRLGRQAPSLGDSHCLQRPGTPISRRQSLRDGWQRMMCVPKSRT